MKQRFSSITPATWITISRFLLTPFVLLPLLFNRRGGGLITLVLLTLAVLTDAVDGYVARRFNQVSDLGKFLDPLADKLLALSSLLVLSFRGRAPLAAVLIIVFRELLISAWRWRALQQGMSFSASTSAKIKTDCQWLGIALLLISPHVSGSDIVQGLGELALNIGACLALYSIMDYLPIRRAMKRKEKFRIHP